MTKSEKTKKLLYESALSLFKEKGFDKATMRGIAERAQMSLGSTYYYFKSKEEIAFYFYEESQAFLQEIAQSAFKKYADLESRLQALYDSYFAQGPSFREMAKVLARIVADPDHELSAFSDQTKQLRQNTIALFGRAIENLALPLPESAKKRMPIFLWFFHMALLFYWVHDPSPQQENTQKLRQKGISMLSQLVQLAGFPMFKGFQDEIEQLFNDMKMEEWLLG